MKIDTGLNTGGDLMCVECEKSLETIESQQSQKKRNEELCRLTVDIV